MVTKPRTKSTTKRAPAKRSTKTSATKKPQQSQSFKVAPETQPFLSFNATRQTIYWAVFALAVLTFGLWLIMINVRLQDLYDQIDQNRIAQEKLDIQFQALVESKKSEQ